MGKGHEKKSIFALIVSSFQDYELDGRDCLLGINHKYIQQSAVALYTVIYINKGFKTPKMALRWLLKNSAN